MSSEHFLKQDDIVVCVDPTWRTLKQGERYVVDCVYAQWGTTQYVYLRGVSDVVPFRSDRFKLDTRTRPNDLLRS